MKYLIENTWVDLSSVVAITYTEIKKHPTIKRIFFTTINNHIIQVDYDYKFKCVDKNNFEEYLNSGKIDYYIPFQKNYLISDEVVVINPFSDDKETEDDFNKEFEEIYGKLIDAWKGVNNFGGGKLKRKNKRIKWA